MPALPQHRPPAIPKTSFLSDIPLPKLPAQLYHPDRHRVCQNPSVSCDHRSVAARDCQRRKYRPARARTQPYRKRLGELRQQIQTNLYASLPGELMTGMAFEADELYQNAGEKVRPIATWPTRRAGAPI